MFRLDLETLLHPCTVAKFLDEYFGREFLHIAGFTEKFARLVPESSISGILAGPAQIFENADEVHNPVAVLSQDIERVLEAPIRVQLHAQSTSVSLHRCERDTILLQLSGNFDCKFHGSLAEPASQTEWEGLLKTGDALYIPRGAWRAAVPGDRPSVQLSFGIQNPTGADLILWMTEKVKQHEAFSKDIPRFADPATRADYVTDLRRVLARMLRTPALLERYRRDTNLNAQPRTVSAGTWAANVPEDHVIAILTPRPIRIKRADRETILLISMGKRLAFPRDAAPLLHYLCDKAPVSIAEFHKSFESEFDVEELSDLLSALGENGIIGLREPHSV